jgi:Txe/YoeB family toxin of toxin-antitoxin system
MEQNRNIVKPHLSSFRQRGQEDNVVSRAPFQCIGKPEPLRGDLSGWWSRRITQEHRLVYRVKYGALEVAQCRYC